MNTLLKLAWLAAMTIVPYVGQYVQFGYNSGTPAASWQQIQPPSTCVTAASCTVFDAADGNLYAETFLYPSSVATNYIFKVAKTSVANTGTLNFTATTNTSTSLTSVVGGPTTGTYYVTGAGIANGTILTVSGSTYTVAPAATASATVTLTSSNQVTWTQVGGTIVGSNNQEFISTIAYVGGTLYVALSNTSTVCDLYYLASGTTWTSPTGYTNTACTNQLIYTMKGSLSGKLLFAAGKTLWQATTVGGTAFTEISTDMYNGWPALGSASIFTLQDVTIGGNNCIAVGGEFALAVGNMGWTAACTGMGTGLFGASVTADNLTAMVYDTTNSVFTWSMPAVTGYPPNDVNIMPVSSFTITQPTCADPYTPNQCPYVNNGLSTSAIGYLKAKEMFWSARRAGFSTIYFLLSSDDGATWVDIRNLGTPPTVCTGAGPQNVQWQSYYSTDRVFMRCGTVSIGEYVNIP